jgi:hypothetical protein
MTGTTERPRGIGWPAAAAWGLTAVAAVAVVWLAVGLVGRCSPASIAEGFGGGMASAARDLRDMLKPSVTVSPLVVLRGEDRTPKLVVYTHSADVVAPIENTYPFWGSTYSSATARNARAQFVVPLDAMDDRDIVFTPGREGVPARILVVAPRPRVDADMLVIPPEAIEITERNTGMQRVARLFSAPDRERLTRLLRPALLEAMNRPDVRARAEQAGREYFERQFADMLRTDLRLGRDVVVDVRWVDG